MFRTDYTQSAAMSLQTSATFQLIKEMNTVHSPNVISTTTLREKYSDIPLLMDPNIRTALANSPLIFKSSYLAIHFRLCGHVHYGLTEDPTKTKTLEISQDIPWCQNRNMALNICVKSKMDVEKTDVLITLKNGMIPAEELLDQALNHLHQHGFGGSMKDAKVVYHFSRGPNHGEKMIFETFFPFCPTSQDSINGTSEFKGFLTQVFQEIGWKITNEDPSVFSKFYKTKKYNYSLVLSCDNPELEDWDTCPCYSFSCTGAPVFFKEKKDVVCANF